MLKQHSQVFVTLMFLADLAAVAVAWIASYFVRFQAGVFPYETQVETLDNGLKVVMVPMKSEGLVAYWTIVRTGSRDEYEPGHSGFAHFFEHMMFRGTERFPQDTYSRIVTEMGADANAFTTDDLTAFHLSITAEDLERTMEIESDRFQDLAYSEEAFRTEAKTSAFCCLLKSRVTSSSVMPRFGWSLPIG